jgi:hypothetical protein
LVGPATNSTCEVSRLTVFGCFCANISAVEKIVIAVNRGINTLMIEFVINWIIFLHP